MRVLWFTNIPLPDFLNYLGKTPSGSGWWMDALAKVIVGSDSISSLGIVCAAPGVPETHVNICGIDYFSISLSRIGQLTSSNRREEIQCFSRIQTIIANFQPNLIHIHGTERFYGLLKEKMSLTIPVVVSLQGIVAECSQFAWGDQSLLSMVTKINFTEFRRGFPTLFARYRYYSNGLREQNIIRSADAILGRTSWDRGYSKMIAPDVPYYHVDEIMRPEFYGPKWDFSEVQPLQVYTTAKLTFSKGMHTLLNTIAILKRDFPKINVRVAGAVDKSLEASYMVRLVKKLGLNDNITFLGWIPASDIVRELMRSRVYLNTSFIENSSNSIQEAMLLGCPCIAAFTGGNTSMIEHNKDGILVANGCHYMFAQAVYELFKDDSLCKLLGSNARQRALGRNDYDSVSAQLNSAYKDVIRQRKFT